MINRSTLTSRRAVTLLAAGALASVGLGIGTTQVGAHGDETARLTNAQRTVIKEATRQFRNEEVALAAGYASTDDCVPGMGYHYVRPDLLVGDVNIDPTLPEILVYVPTRNGGRKLGAVEYMRDDFDQDKTTDPDRPTLFSHPFDGPMDGHAPGLPVHYDLHVWLYKDNPAGELIGDNPDVICP